MVFDANPGVLLAYSSRMYCKNMRTGMLIIIVSSATRIVNTGSDGGFAILHSESSLLHIH